MTPPGPGARLVGAFARLSAIDRAWTIDFGPKDGDGWMRGIDLTRPDSDPLRPVLAGIGEGLQTDHRKVIAAAFALRVGWSAAAAVGPYLVARCVPDVRLDNVSLRFTVGGFFERVSLHRPRASFLRADVPSGDAETAIVENCDALLARLRDTLFESAEPVVSALHAWSHFPARALWGQVMSSWAAPFVQVLARTRAVRAAEVVARVGALFDDPRPAFRMRPTFTEATRGGRVSLAERRATCCLYYRLPSGSYCPSCPLVPVAESVRRSRAMKAAAPPDRGTP